MLKTQTRFEKDDEGSNMMPQVGWWKIKGSFSGRRRVRRQRGICGDFNLEDLLTQSLKMFIKVFIKIAFAYVHTYRISLYGS